MITPSRPNSRNARLQCAAVREAYDLWSEAATEDELVAFAAYEAALDEEERSSQAYADLVRRVLKTRVKLVLAGGQSNL